LNVDRRCRPRYLVDLFVRPRRFFLGNLGTGRPPCVILVGWVYGISHAIDRLDTQLMRAELGHPPLGWTYVGPLVAGSWLGFWTWVLVAGVLGAFFLWWIGGWWYQVRLRWSGVPAPDKRRARLLFMYSSFVFAGPAVVAALIRTLRFPNDAAACAAAHGYPLVLLLVLLFFPFWSVATSYVGVKALFAVTRRKAVVWFVALPMLVYVIWGGLVALLFTLVGRGAV
jgi:hypothetical protein